MAKPLYWDMLNPLTGTPFTMDDPNLYFNDEGIGMYKEPGDPGFTPYPNQLPNPAPKPAKKPFRRKPKPRSNEPTTTPTGSQTPVMSTFQYNTAPNPNGGFTTRAVLGEQISETALTAALAAAAGITAAQAEIVIKTFFAKLLEAAAGSGWSPGLYGVIRMRPTSGGSEPSPDAFHNADDINADVSLSILMEARTEWRSGLTLESMGEVGLVTPVIDSIICEENGATDHYMPGTLIRLRGDNLKFKKSDVLQGVFFTPASGPEVRATVYGILDPTEATVLVPATLSGPLTVRIAAFINGSVRSFTYTNPIT